MEKGTLGSSGPAAGDSSAIGLLPSPLPSPLPTGLEPDQQREAARSLKGRPLRVEVFAAKADWEDAGIDAANPFTVTLTNFGVTQLQPREGNRHGVYLVEPGETVAYQYERTSADPRVSHALTLATDSYGQVTRAAAVSHPRRASDHPVDGWEQTTPIEDEIEALHVVVTETDFINQDDTGDADDTNKVRHLGVPYQMKAWELTGGSATDTAPYTVATLNSAFSGATEIRFDETATSGDQTRQLPWVKSWFANDGLTASLTLGSMGLRALPWESQQVAFTSQGVSTSLPSGWQTQLTQTLLTTEGAYVWEAGSSRYWVKSGRTVFDNTHFYLPTSHTDSFGETCPISQARRRPVREPAMCGREVGVPGRKVCDAAEARRLLEGRMRTGATPPAAPRR